jgi:glycosyltransferase involved in cell wall biosynthesis
VASSYTDWDAVIVDQSHTDATESCVQALTQNFRYITSTTSGSSAARNLALAHAQGPLVAYTDDDCEVSPEWLERLVEYYRRYPESGLIYGAVHAGPHDPRAGFIPTAPITRFRRIAAPRSKWRERGIGANMAGPLEALRQVGGFDEALGSGGPLRANLDGDLTYRMLKAGYVVLNVPDAVVIHHGFRTWQQGRQLMRGVGIGVGATYMKHVRLGDPAAVLTFLIEWLRCISWGRLLTLRPHVGLRRFFGYGMGVILSFRYPIDPRTRVYIAPSVGQPAEASQADQRVDIPAIMALPGTHRLSLLLLNTSLRGHVSLHLAAIILPSIGSTSLLPPILWLAFLCAASRPAKGLRWSCRGLI